MRVVEGIINRLGIAGELLTFFWQHKWWWLTPMLLALLFVGALVIFAQSSAIAPFIYTLF
ncbi:MAG: hypothetical protein HY216_05330 [Candidatus Rokubacteria bacterium]|nr:hypothetical protein [Candidatus Rokubacteria bacterium]